MSSVDMLDLCNKTSRSIWTLFFGRSNAWHHPLEIISLAVWMPGVIRLKFFVSHLKSWHHLFEIFRQLFEWLASSVRNFSSVVWTSGIIPTTVFVSRSNGWHHPFKNLSLAVQMAGMIHLKFFLCCPNLHSISSNFFDSCSNSTWNCFKLLEHPFVIHSFWLFNVYTLVCVFAWEVTNDLYKSKSARNKFIFKSPLGLMSTLLQR